MELNPALENLRYPLGKYEQPEVIDPVTVNGWINQIEAFPAQIRREVENLSDEELNKTYREGGWSIKQLVHHIAESHMNGYIRFKWALTEDAPTIKPYHQDAWARQPDHEKTPVEVSLKLIESLHQRWSILMHTLGANDLGRTFYHPDQTQQVSIESQIGHYAWHGEHHLEQIRMAKGQ